MPLTGPGFAVRNRDLSTGDGAQDGRWLAVDESGWDGEQLHDRQRRYLTVAIVAVDDEVASGMVSDMRDAVGQRQAPELKFRHLRTMKGAAAFLDLFGAGGALADRCLAHAVDKEYSAVAKIIDLLVEEQDYDQGDGDLLFSGKARQMARTFYNDGPRALRDGHFDRLVDAFVRLASSRGRDDPQAAADRLFDEIERAWPHCHRKPVTEILMRLRTTRRFADEIHSDDPSVLPALEMLVPSLVQLIRWTHPLGAVSVLVDEQRVFTDDVLELLEDKLRNPDPISRRLRQPRIDLRALVRGSSAAHPSVQLADLVAGAAGSVMNTVRGQDPVVDALRPCVLGLLDENSIMPNGFGAFA